MTSAGTWIRFALLRFFCVELRAWRGELSLSPIFWGYGVVASFALIALHAMALERGDLPLQQILIIASFFYTAWILVAIWRCAAHAAPFWGQLARWLTLAWGFNAVLVLLFLQVELVLRYARG